MLHTSLSRIEHSTDFFKMGPTLTIVYLYRIISEHQFLCYKNERGNLFQMVNDFSYVILPNEAILSRLLFKVKVHQISLPVHEQYQ